MEDGADDILMSVNLSEEEGEKYEVVRAKFNGHFIKKRSVIFSRVEFHRRVQGHGEVVVTFITDL